MHTARTHPPHVGSSHAPQRPAPCLAQAGGFTFAAEMDGCNQIKLLKAVAKVGAENNELSRVTLYEEWDSVDSSLQCGVYRADQELLERGLGFDAGSGKLMALQMQLHLAKLKRAKPQALRVISLKFQINF